MMNRFVDMETFVCIAENQNLVAAAGELAVSTAFVTRRLQDLERRLSVRLLYRTTRRISLTETGRKYYEFSKRILKEVREEESALTKSYDEPSGAITVVSPVSFGIMEMGKAITEFMMRRPLIKITLVIGDNGRRSYDPGDHGADIILRFARARETNLHARVLGKSKWILCASPAYLRKAGVPKQVSDLANHSCLVTTKPYVNGAWRLDGPHGTEKLKVTGVVSPNSAITMRYMALDGAGVALLPTFCVAADIREKKLTAVLSDYCGLEQPIYAYYAHPRQQPLCTRLFVQFLEKRFKTADWSLDPAAAFTDTGKSATTSMAPANRQAR